MSIVRGIARQRINELGKGFDSSVVGETSILAAAPIAIIDAMKTVGNFMIRDAYLLFIYWYVFNGYNAAAIPT